MVAPSRILISSSWIICYSPSLISNSSFKKGLTSQIHWSWRGPPLKMKVRVDLAIRANLNQYSNLMKSKLQRIRAQPRIAKVELWAQTRKYSITKKLLNRDNREKCLWCHWCNTNRNQKTMQHSGSRLNLVYCPQEVTMSKNIEMSTSLTICYLMAIPSRYILPKRNKA